MDTPVIFEIAKLLKEKKYANITPHKLRRSYYNHLGVLNGGVTEYIKAFCNNQETSHLETIDAPTIAEVIMWIYEEHGIWIEIFIDDNKTFGYFITRFIEGYRSDSTIVREFNSPTEAYSEAIKYTLKENIKQK